MSDVANDPSLRLPFRRPFAADTLLAFLGARALPGVEEVRNGTYRRSERAADGSPVTIALSPEPCGGSRHTRDLEGWSVRRDRARAPSTPSVRPRRRSRCHRYEAGRGSSAGSARRAPAGYPDPGNLRRLRARRSSDLRTAGVRGGREDVARQARREHWNEAGAGERRHHPPVPDRRTGGRAPSRLVRDASRTGDDDPNGRRARREGGARPLRGCVGRRSASRPRPGPRDRSLDPRLRRDARPPRPGRVHGRRPGCAKGVRSPGAAGRTEGAPGIEPNAGARGVRTQ